MGEENSMARLCCLTGSSGGSGMAGRKLEEAKLCSAEGFFEAGGKVLKHASLGTLAKDIPCTPKKPGSLMPEAMLTRSNGLGSNCRELRNYVIFCVFAHGSQPGLDGLVPLFVRGLPLDAV